MDNKLDDQLDKLDEEFKQSADKLDKETEDFDFDFAHLEKELGRNDDDEEESIINQKKPAVTALRSRYSNGELTLKQIANIGMHVSKLAIQVDSRTKEIPTLWRYFSALYELWALIKNIYGSAIIKEMNYLFKICEDTLMVCDNNKRIEPKIYSRLRFLKDRLYTLRQYSNLGFEVEGTAKAGFKKSKSKIVN